MRDFGESMESGWCCRGSRVSDRPPMSHRTYGILGTDQLRQDRTADRLTEAHRVSNLNSIFQPAKRPGSLLQIAPMVPLETELLVIMIRRPARESVRWRRMTVGVAAALVLSACGSTVQHSDTVPVGPGALSDDGDVSDDDGLSLAEPSGVADATSPTSGPGTSRGPSDVASEDGSIGPSGATAGRGPGDGGQVSGPGTRGRGFTANEVFVGLAISSNASEIYTAIGSRPPKGDMKNAYQALVDDINKHGGLAGRKVVPVFFDVNIVEAASNANAVAQKACTRWTEDRPVFAAVSVAGPINNDVLFQCLANRKTPFTLSDDRVRASAQMSRYAQSGLYYAPPMPTIERLVPAWIQRAKTNGYFSKWDTISGRPGVADVKVGVLDTRLHEYGAGRFTQEVKRALARHGIEVGATFMFSGEASSISREASQAVLQFSRAEVTHVIPSWGMIPFTQQAESQNYRPRYTVNTSNWPQQQLQLSPHRQLSGALGVGYRPTQDVDNARDPGDVSKAATRCRKLMRDAGEPTSDRDAMVFNVMSCDGIWFLADAIDKGGDELSTVGLRRGVRALGSVPSASTFRMSFPQGRPDGASALRDLVFRNDCAGGQACYAYSSGKNHGM